MKIREGNKWKAAFRGRYSHFEYLVMFFRLTNAPALFQGYINKILAKKLDVFVIVYLNDILIYTKTKSEEDVEAVWWELEQLQKDLLYVNLKKCQFHEYKLRFFSYNVFHQDI